MRREAVAPVFARPASTAGWRGGLITGFVAKEVVVGSFASPSRWPSGGSGKSTDLGSRLREDVRLRDTAARRGSGPRVLGVRARLHPCVATLAEDRHPGVADHRAAMRRSSRSRGSRHRRLPGERVICEPARLLRGGDTIDAAASARASTARWRDHGDHTPRPASSSCGPQRAPMRTTPAPAGLRGLPVRRAATGRIAGRRPSKPRVRDCEA